MAKEKTREEYRQEVERLNQWCDFLAKMLDEKSKDLDNAQTEIVRLRKQLANLQTQQPAPPTPARPEPEPTAKRPGRKAVISDTDRQYVHELYKAKDGDGKRLHSIRGIADHVGISKSRVAEILQEPEQPGRWYATDPTGNRTYYSDYHAALQSGKHIDYEVTAYEAKVDTIRDEYQPDATTADIIRQQLQQTDKTIMQISADTGVSVLTVVSVLSDLQNDLLRIDRRLKDIEKQRYALEREEAQLLSLKHRTIARTSGGKITYDLRFGTVEPAVFYFTDENGTKTELLTAYIYSESIQPRHMTLRQVPSMYQDAFVAAWAAAVMEYKTLDRKRKEQAKKASQQMDDIINNLLRNGQNSDIGSIPEPNKKAIVRTLEKSFHPDNGGNQDIFQDVQKIKNLLNTGTV